MAFEQNQQLGRLVNPQQQYGMQQMQMPPQGISSSPLSGKRMGWLEGFKNQILGTPAYQLYENTNTPEQTQGYNDVLRQGRNAINNPYEGFDDIRNETYRQYNEQILPGIAERFTSMGGGKLSSPDFTREVGQSASGLGALINAQRAQYGQQNKQYGLQALNIGLRPQYQSTFVPRQMGLPENLAVTGAHAVGSAIGHGLTGGF